MSACFLTGAAILRDGGWLHDHGVLLQDGVIRAILPDGSAVAADRVALPAGSLLAPGLIDIQVNGGGGILFNDAPTAQAARAIAAAHRRLGTTSVLPTLITDTRETFCQAVEHAWTGPGVLGIHFEGPFLSQARPGVHPAALIRPPDEADLAMLCGLAGRLDGRVLLTLAPETVTDEAVRRLCAAGIKLAAGHSAASFERVSAALAAGLTGFTHMFNAMPSPAGRDPGIVAAALLDGGSYCGVIADGIHVHPAMLRLLLACRGVERVMLVSDAMAPAGTDATEFWLQGRRILRRDGRLVTEGGVLAGADLCLAEAVRRAVRLAGLSPAQALTMASSVPAAFLGLADRVGSIAVGLRADLVLLSADLDVLATWLGGDDQGFWRP